jgi:cytochrome P450
VVRRFSSTTLDVIGNAILGVDLHSFQSATPFHELYRRAFEPSPWGLFLIVVNAIVPIRWINIGENRRFNDNMATLHSLVRDVIRWRLWEMDTRVADDKDHMQAERQDLLTYIIKESRQAGEKWTENELLGHVGEENWIACDGPDTLILTRS